MRALATGGLRWRRCNRLTLATALSVTHAVGHRRLNSGGGGGGGGGIVVVVVDAIAIVSGRAGGSGGGAGFALPVTLAASSFMSGSGGGGVLAFLVPVGEDSGGDTSLFGGDAARAGSFARSSAALARTSLAVVARSSFSTIFRFGDTAAVTSVTTSGLDCCPGG